MKIFQETLEPLLKERRIFYEVRVTQKPKEVEEFFQTSTAISLREKYSAIVILSGDGLLFEAIQGLYQRTTSLEEESPKNHKVIHTNYEPVFFCYADTLQKKDVCSRQNTPNKLNGLYSAVFHADFKNMSYSFVNATASKWRPKTISLAFHAANGGSANQNNKTSRDVRVR